MEGPTHQYRLVSHVQLLRLQPVFLFSRIVLLFRALFSTLFDSSGMKQLGLWHEEASAQKTGTCTYRCIHAATQEPSAAPYLCISCACALTYFEHLRPSPVDCLTLAVEMRLTDHLNVSAEETKGRRVCAASASASLQSAVAAASSAVALLPFIASPVKKDWTATAREHTCKKKYDSTLPTVQTKTDSGLHESGRTNALTTVDKALVDGTFGLRRTSVRTLSCSTMIC